MAAEEKGPANDIVRLKIEQRAYEIWQSEGSHHGCDIDHWLRAAAEITSSHCTAAADVEDQLTPGKGTSKK